MAPQVIWFFVLRGSVAVLFGFSAYNATRSGGEESRLPDCGLGNRQDFHEPLVEFDE
jgi:hypothetical protein